MYPLHLLQLFYKPILKNCWFIDLLKLLLWSKIPICKFKVCVLFVMLASKNNNSSSDNNCSSKFMALNPYWVTQVLLCTVQCEPAVVLLTNKVDASFNHIKYILFSYVSIYQLHHFYYFCCHFINNL